MTGLFILLLLLLGIAVATVLLAALVCMSVVVAVDMLPLCCDSKENLTVFLLLVVIPVATPGLLLVLAAFLCLDFLPR